jgi:ABC-type molybdate transport system substrate-binding protein
MSLVAESVRLHAAGSLRAALTEVGHAFERSSGIGVQARFGPSAVMKDEIAQGAKAAVFASADMGHPQQLAEARNSGPVMLFARNRICALVRPGLAVDSTNLLDRMLDPEIKLGTSTPVTDPCGDYAWQVFRKADAVKPGAFAVLDRKALQLTGGPAARPVPLDRTVYGALVADGEADIFLTYVTNAQLAQNENPGQQIVALPNTLATGADYGLIVMADAPRQAYRFAYFIMSVEGQRILAEHGFDAPALPA